MLGKGKVDDINETEADIRLEINESLRNKGWTLTGSNRDVFTEKHYPGVGYADYVLHPKSRANPLMVIEAKRRGKDLDIALDQAKRYARKSKAPIAYSSDGSTTKTFHMLKEEPLLLNGEEVDEFITETQALNYLETNEYNSLDKEVITSRHKLIHIFSSADEDLRREGLDQGLPRFNEFCKILFLKLFSEEESNREKRGEPLKLPKEYHWDCFKGKDGVELLSYVNDTIIRKFQDEYKEDIFRPLKIQKPKTLKKIIDRIDPLSLIDIDSDIKGDAFEYFLKAYSANQHQDLGQYFTPRHIVKTLVKLANPKFGEKIYDPFCGTGGFLIESFKHIYNKMPRNKDTLKYLKNNTIYGRELTLNARATKMNMILTGDGHNNIEQTNSLENPVDNKYDLVLTNIPFLTPSENKLCIEHCFKAVDPNSENPRIGAVVPESILHGSTYKTLRETIYKKSYVENIIALPEGSFKPYTDSKTYILYLKNVRQKKKKQKSVWHFTVKNDGYTLNVKREKKIGDSDLDVFLSCNRTEDQNKLLQVGFDKLLMEDLERNDYISTAKAYKEIGFTINADTVQLKDLIEEIDIRNTSSYPVWSITKEGHLVSSEKRFKERVASKNTHHYKVIPKGAFCFRAVADRDHISFCFNIKGELGCVSPYYLVYRIKEEAESHPNYLNYVLNKQNTAFQKNLKLKGRGTRRPSVSKKDFLNLKIPILPLTEQLECVKEIEKRKEEIRIAEEIIQKKIDGLWK